jgi:hypothetical protein
MTYDPETHTYYDASGARVPSGTQILSAAGHCGDPRFYRAGAAERGSRVHLITEELDRYGETLMEIDDEVGPYVAAFQAWAKDHNPAAVEVLCSGSYPIPYAGRIDRLYKIDGLDGLTVVDIKTGAPAPWHRVQLYAYALALGEPNSAALYLSPGKPARLVVTSLQQAEEAGVKWAEACERWPG